MFYSSFRCYQGACSHNDSSKNSNLHNKVNIFFNVFYHRNYFGNMVIHTFDIFNIYTGQYGFCSATSSAFPATWPGWCCCRRSTSPAPASTTGSRRWCSAGCCPWWPAGAGPPATTLSRVETVSTLWVGTNFSYFLITRYTHDKLEPWIKTMISEHGGCPTAYVHLRVKTESHKQSHVDHGQGLQVYQLWCRLVDSWWLFHQVCVCYV